MNLLRAVVAFWFLLSFVVQYVFSVGEVGFVAHSKDGQMHVSAGSHPVFLVWSAIGLVSFLVLMRMKAEETFDGIPSLKRRFLALVIDFSFSVTVITSLAAMLPLWLESMRTGHFSWHFSRDYSLPADEIFIVPEVLLSMGLTLLYFVWPLTKGKQTVGCFILRLRVTPPYGDRGVFTFRQALQRTWCEFKGLCSLLRIGEQRDSDGRTWYDRETNCTVILIRYT
jgi:RDD family protein